jgi:hypothetical protein
MTANTMIRTRVSLIAIVILFALINVRVSDAALSVSFATVSVVVGNSQQVTITGGTGFYKITSSDEKIATATISGSTVQKVTIQGVALGTAVITIEDDTGATATIDVTVSGLTFDKTSIIVQPAGSVTITILTGTPAYTVVSSDDTIATALVASDKITITGVATGSATITVSDSSSVSAVISVQVGPSFTLNPTSVAISINETTNSIISGSSGYTVSSSDTAIATASIVTDANSITKVLITGIAAGSAIITVEDVLKSTATINVTVDTIYKKVVTLGVGETEKVSLTGGTGFYNVDISDNLVAKITLNKDDAVVEGIAGGKTTITFTDNSTNKLVVDVTVKLSPPQLNYEVNGTLLKLYWDQITNADSYLLYYALPDANGDLDPTQYGQANLGSLNSHLFDLNKGDIYFVILQAISSSSADIASDIDISQVIKIIIP